MEKAVRICCFAVLAAFCLASAAVAQTTLVTLTGNQSGPVYDNIYMSPYYATVGGVANTPVICDDFGDNSYFNSTWTATVTSFSNINSNNTSWGVAGKNTALYGAVGFLVGQLLTAPPNSLTQIVDTFELWAIFDPSGPTGVQNYLATTSVGAGAPISTLALCTEIFGACTADAAANPGGLLGQLLGMNYSNSGLSLIVLSPTTGGGICAAGNDNCAAQEFITVSEGGTTAAYLLLAGICCAGAMFLRSRRRFAARTIA